MKLSAYNNIKNGFAVRIAILKASIVDTFNEDTAYVSENWAAVVSTTTYTLTFALFIKVLFSNVNSIAGYSENEMLFFLWISQFSFYLQYILFDLNLDRISDLVNTGGLDLILAKPIPSLFYLSFKRISILSILREVVPALFFLGLLIDWGELNFEFVNLFVGMLIFVLGLFTLYVMSLFAALPAFWLGRNQEIYALSRNLQWLGRKEIPFEGFPDPFKAVFTTVIPILISTGLSTSVILGKRDPWETLIFVIFIALILQVLKSIFWKKAMKTYSSASS